MPSTAWRRAFPATDVFALAAVAFRMLTGEVCFEAGGTSRQRVVLELDGLERGGSNRPLCPRNFSSESRCRR
jgi:hypothetical protein